MMSPPWEAIATAAIAPIVAAFVWIVSPMQRRKERAAALKEEASTASECSRSSTSFSER